MNICPYCNEWHNENIACSAMSAGINRVKKDLTKRELFAAMAMQGLLAMNQPSEERGKEAPNIISKASVIMADALITELDKERE